jgi:hypothetical protein
MSHDMILTAASKGVPGSAFAAPPIRLTRANDPMLAVGKEPDPPKEHDDARKRLEEFLRDRLPQPPGGVKPQPPLDTDAPEDAPPAPDDRKK